MTLSTRLFALAPSVAPGQDFDEEDITSSAIAAYSVYTADLDGDGDADVLSASWWDDKIA